MLRLRTQGFWGVAALLFLLSMAGCRSGLAPAEGQPPQDRPAPSQPAENPFAITKAPADIVPLPGRRAPEIIAADVSTGELVTLSSLKGQVVLLNFWATWCGPCRAEMPHMEELHKELRGRLRVVALGADGTETPEQMNAFARGMNLTFTVAHDDGEALFKYRVVGIPTSFFIDEDGIIRVRQPGPMNMEQMRRFFTQTEKFGSK